MVDPAQDVVEARPHEASRGLVPPGVEPDDPRIVVQLECPHATVRRQQPQRNRDALCQRSQARVDRKARLVGRDRVLEPGVEHALLPVQIRVVWQRRPAEMRDSAVVVVPERRIRRQRHADSIELGAPRRVSSSYSATSRAIQTVAAVRSASSARARSRYPLSALRHVDVAHGLQRHADEQPQPLALRLQERLDDDVVRDVVRTQAGRRREDERPAQSQPADGTATCLPKLRRGRRRPAVP